MDTFVATARLGRLILFSALSLALPLHAAPYLSCEISYGGETRVVTAAVGADPYGVKAEDIAERFRIKAVVVGSGNAVEYIKLYVYFQVQAQPVLLHEARYLPPFMAGAGPYALTGLNYVYAPGLGQELQYGCALTGASA